MRTGSRAAQMWTTEHTCRSALDLQLCRIFAPLHLSTVATAKTLWTLVVL